MSEAKKFVVVGVKNYKSIERTAAEIEDVMNHMQADGRQVQLIKNKNGSIIVGTDRGEQFPALTSLLTSLGHGLPGGNKGEDNSAEPTALSARSSELLNRFLDRIHTYDAVDFVAGVRQHGTSLVHGFSAQELLTASEELEREVYLHEHSHKDLECSFGTVLGSVAKFAKEAARLQTQ